VGVTAGVIAGESHLRQHLLHFGVHFAAAELRVQLQPSAMISPTVMRGFRDEYGS